MKPHRNWRGFPAAPESGQNETPPQLAGFRFVSSVFWVRYARSALAGTAKLHCPGAGNSRGRGSATTLLENACENPQADFRGKPLRAPASTALGCPRISATVKLPCPASTFASLKIQQIRCTGARVRNGYLPSGTSVSPDLERYCTTSPEPLPKRRTRAGPAPGPQPERPSAFRSLGWTARTSRHPYAGLHSSNTS